MRVRVGLCLPCAAKLRAIRDEKGEAAMTVAMSRTLCAECIARVRQSGGIAQSTPVRFELRRPS